MDKNDKIGQIGQIGIFGQIGKLNKWETIKNEEKTRSIEVKTLMDQ